MTRADEIQSLRRKLAALKDSRKKVVQQIKLLETRLAAATEPLARKRSPSK